MAYYDALKTKWAQAPAGTTQSKCDWINAQTVTGPAVKMIVPNYEIYNRVDRTEYKALAAADEASVQRNLAITPVDYSPGSNLRGLFATIFPVGASSPSTSATQRNLAPYVAQFATPQIPCATAPLPLGGGGLKGMVSVNDATAAGLS